MSVSKPPPKKPKQEYRPGLIPEPHMDPGIHRKPTDMRRAAAALRRRARTA